MTQCSHCRGDHDDIVRPVAYHIAITVEGGGRALRVCGENHLDASWRAACKLHDEGHIRTDTTYAFWVSDNEGHVYRVRVGATVDVRWRAWETTTEVRV